MRGDKARQKALRKSTLAKHAPKEIWKFKRDKKYIAVNPRAKHICHRQITQEAEHTRTQNPATIGKKCFFKQEMPLKLLICKI